MNKNGFTLVELLVTIVIIAMIMSIVLPSAIKLSEENNKKIYEEYEKMMVEYARVSPLKTENIIYLTDLEEVGDLIKDDCTGYVIINHSVTPETYKAYISCDDYETVGYNSNS